MKDCRGLTNSVIVAVSMIAVAMSAYTEEERKVGDGPSIIRQLSNSTTRTVVATERNCRPNGDFVVVGAVLTQTAPGTVVPVPSRALRRADRKAAGNIL